MRRMGKALRAKSSLALHLCSGCRHLYSTSPLLPLSSFPLPLPAAPATGSTNIETSASQLPLVPATSSINIETSTPRPPATPATGSADTETSAGVDNTKQVEVGSLLSPPTTFQNNPNTCKEFVLQRSHPY
ncbi:hypothetical protein QBC32DRAFT_89829 [Pseudoneurospora amorphoporcata]|uniref:Uncharacterized protein n=1 Tax=Pseudoneurospora amorphoporcata TaxID=241081 RepID=A0AAN6NM35_9PEZI|nr:hypothetical protein QBC32DRAFT_89829 [Pseudoneurospora amorphoporcata]